MRFGKYEGFSMVEMPVVDQAPNLLLFDVEPVAYVRQTRADRWKKRPAVLKYRAFRDRLREKAGDYTPSDGDIIHFHVAMPKSWSKKKRKEMIGKPHKQRPDLDNFLKGFWDAFGEDSHLSDVTVRKVWAIEGRIMVEPL